MIDLSLSQIDAEDQQHELICKMHKRKIIAFCAQPDCHSRNRFVCSFCLSSPNIHHNHNPIEISEILKLINGGKQNFQNNLTSTFDLLIHQIVSSLQINLKQFVTQKAQTIISRFEMCFTDNLDTQDTKISESLFKLYEFQHSFNGNYIKEVCEQKGEKLKYLWKKEIEEFKQLINEKEFAWELQRFDIENQIIHNLSNEALESYKKYKNEAIFNEIDCENEFDSKLYMVNDRNYYTVSQFNKEGQRCGRAIEIPQQNHYYQGYIQNGKRSGKGLYIYEDGSIYIGEFKNDQKEGVGKLIKPNGYVYQGEWKNDLKSGIGKERFNENLEFEGFFVDNLRNGPGQETNIQENEFVQAIYEKGEVVTVLSSNKQNSSSLIENINSKL